MRFRSSENHLCAYGTGEQVVQTVGLFLTNGWVSHSNGWTFLSNGWASRSNGWMLLPNGWASHSNGWTFLSNGWSSRSNRCKFFWTDDPGRSNECKFRLKTESHFSTFSSERSQFNVTVQFCAHYRAKIAHAMFTISNWIKTTYDKIRVPKMVTTTVNQFKRSATYGGDRLFFILYITVAISCSQRFCQVCKSA